MFMELASVAQILLFFSLLTERLRHNLLYINALQTRRIPNRMRKIPLIGHRTNVG